jgi:hypothetical protein
MENEKLERLEKFKDIKAKMKDGTYTVARGAIEARKIGCSFGIANPAIDACIKDTPEWVDIESEAVEV